MFKLVLGVWRRSGAASDVFTTSWKTVLRRWPHVVAVFAAGRDWLPAADDLSEIVGRAMHDGPASLCSTDQRKTDPTSAKDRETSP